MGLFDFLKGPSIDEGAPDKSTPLFLYCRSGARSAQATNQLQRAGYSNVKNIGGIVNYSGAVERA